MNVNVINIANAENDKLVDRIKELGVYHQALEKTFDFMYNSFLEKFTMNDQGFVGVYSITITSMTRAYIAILRGHFLSYTLEMRFAIENLVLSLYFLHTGWKDEYVKYNEDETLDMDGMGKYKSKAYKWLAKDFPDENLFIWKTKARLNKLGVHANLATSPSSYDYETHTLHYFDGNSLFLVTSLTIDIMDNLLLFARLIGRINSLKKNIEFMDSAGDEYDELRDLIRQLRKSAGEQYKDKIEELKTS